MTVRKRSRIWHYDFMIRRVRYRGAIPEARTKAEAEEAERQERHAVYLGRYGHPDGREIFIDYARKTYLTWAKENKRSWQTDEYHINVFEQYFGRKTFAEINPMVVERFKRQRRAAKTTRDGERSVSSVNRELACLSKIFSMAVRDKIVASNPCLEVKKYREQNERTRYLSLEEEEKLLAQCVGPRAHLLPIVLLAINTGMRRGEILKLRWPQVDFERSLIRLGSSQTKAGKPREIPMSEPVNELLKGLFKVRRSDAVIESPRTRGRMVDFKKAFRAACKDAEIEGLRFHDLRHTFGTRAADNGADAFTIAELLGHADLRMTKRYTHATDQRKRAAVENLAKTSSDRHKIVTIKKREAG